MNKEQLVSIPKCIADWIEYNKPRYSLYGAMKHTDSNTKVDAWITSPINQETFALAWINGYNIEKGKKYLVSVNGVDNENKYLKYNISNDYWYFGHISELPFIRVHHTIEDLERYGFLSVFHNPMFTVEEIK